MGLAVVRKGRRYPVGRAVLTTQARRTTARAARAMAEGRIPGKPGPARTVVGSLGGKNGARAADRAAAKRASKKGFKAKPAARVQAKKAATKGTKKRPAAVGKLDLLEVCAYKGSALSKEWARRQLSSVRIVHRVGQQRLKDGPQPAPGRSLNWRLDLDDAKDRQRLVAYVKKVCPKQLWTSPCCRTFCSMQHVNNKRYSRRGRPWRPSGEAEAISCLKFCRKLHRLQQALGGRSHHEQSARLARICFSIGGSRVCVALWDSQATSRVPFDGSIWPWAISRRYKENSATVAGCAVGLADRHGDLLAKEWRVESSDAALLVGVHPWRCSGGHRHGDTSGRLRATAIYPRFFATLVAESVLGR